ncbi:TetR/AcrR family transcriptional regulator C-terminal domain-containing protein [Nocardia rhamnosiphila]|uniref:TetR/AcrR family transcriptional regulator C-terminal domain-containing protein n=1 Tax=Nocardia rhamnosiphila TaxID=426716 RepID=UPI0022472FB5|nr:TetR/AcrR family transcriptional regulator C-terminal domain-containing protein [Nocardia zapadnayensis]
MVGVGRAQGGLHCALIRRPRRLEFGHQVPQHHLLALSGKLRTTDPATAAEQFLALLTGPLENRSAHGTRKVPPAELRAIATAAVRTFLAAYGSGADRPESAPRPR